MSEPARRRTPDHLRVDPASLPDPRLWSRRSPEGGAIRRLLVFAVVGVAALALGAFALKGALARARGAAATASFAALPQLAVEGERGGEPRAAPEPHIATPQELAELHRSWVGSETIAFRDAVVDPATGEEVGEFQGFGIDVETSPSGASVVVDGHELGTSPLLASVRCDPGAAVHVRAERGARAARATTRCRKDALVKLRLSLEGGAPRR